ncbi:MAG: FAD-dependent oxidoreductase [Holosporales bacterium]|jgi:NADPH-dependent glutamate synthase beta subunit-like oxidoreductase|nr:FAD-dependent oxidoreductase [Holosporales bacterium]
MKPFAITLDPGTSLKNHTGSWRTERPVWKSIVPPCNKTCPAGENIQSWLALTEEGKYFEAWQEIVKNNPFPACMGRACYHFCEATCNRAQFDETVAIHSVERFLGDKAIQEKWAFPKVPERADARKVLIIGAGPSGLSAAYHLACKGHRVTVLDRYAEAGGMMRYGIPTYRLSRDVLRVEINRVLDLGVTLHLNTEVSDLAKARHGFDACYLALGAWKARRIENLNSQFVLTAIDFLKNEDPAHRFSGCVAVYGGGNTAFDAARTAKRLGAERVVIIYRNMYTHLSAHDDEIKLALQEGVEILPLHAVRGIEETILTLDVMLPTEGEKVIPSGETEKLSVTHLILAIGQEVETRLFDSFPNIVHSADGVVSVDRIFATGEQGIFAGGDMVPSGRTLTEAIGHGKKAAQAIEAYLSGTTLPQKGKQEIASFNRLNTHYYDHAPRCVERKKTQVVGLKNFQEVFETFSEQEAVYEARRCLSCGNCFSCDTCYGVCPDNAIRKCSTQCKAENNLTFNYDYCKGCGICARECPCGYIQMIPEDK